jgi:hypothetical protein
MLAIALFAWWLLGFVGWVASEWRIWIDYPDVRSDITLLTLMGGVLVAALGGPVFLLVVVVEEGCRRLKRLKWPVLIKGNFP